MIIAFLFVSAFIVVLFLLSQRRTIAGADERDIKDYPLWQLIPAGMMLLDAAGYKFGTNYDRKLLNKLIVLYGPKDSMVNLRVFWAHKIALLLVAMWISSLLGIGMGFCKDYLLFSLLVLGSGFYLSDRELNNRVKKRQLKLQIDFPDFINKLVLLINAGMTVQRAWEKIVRDNNKENPLYEELTAVVTEIRMGRPEHQSYESFALRCRMPEITRFVSTVIQNLKKGNRDMVAVLRLQSAECWEMRKNAAKRLGEEASTKMLLPMVIMMIAILIIVAIPAVIAMQAI